MDIDIGSLIYILITVIAIIGGVAGKKKKPKGARDKNVKPGFLGKLEAQLENFTQEAKDSFGNMKQEPEPGDMEYEEAMEHKEKEEYVEEKDYFEKLGEEYETDNLNEARGNFAAYEGLISPDEEQNEVLIESEGISTTGDVAVSNISEDDPWDFDQQDEMEDFDLQTAVIYSTIINRIEI